MAITVTAFSDRWCPFARVANQADNRSTDGMPHAGTRCIGEACMAWRWYYEDKDTGFCGAFGPPNPIIQREPEPEKSESLPLAELEFAWPLLKEAAAVGDNVTKEDVLEGLKDSSFTLIIRDNSAALVSHCGHFLRVGLASGIMEEMTSIEQEATDIANIFKYEYIEIVGRPGWERVFPDYKRVAVVLRKEL